MPQMAPMNWLILFITFILIFMLFNSLNYFSFLYQPLISIKSKSSKIFSWKW
uniref:ATP synthase complex subunit 8 n=1 Tax=Myrmecocephalus concinnus TaxID=1143072 RepID=A0A0S2M7P6_9COLE|nr:ATP synthase F0 subunit 8 [Myrmecocephalus concinnus]ALO70724.1 ATP synthase F0 subunit 8 [Myrmecocephalus concinnus]